MTTYNGIAGGRVNFLSSDPTYNSSAQDGQVWYNSNSGTLKAWIPVGAWASGGNLGSTIYANGGAGIQTASISFGGRTLQFVYILLLGSLYVSILSHNSINGSVLFPNHNF